MLTKSLRAEWQNGAPGYPHALTITMAGQTNRVSGLRYLPRPATSGANGRIGRFEARPWHTVLKVTTGAC